VKESVAMNLLYVRVHLILYTNTLGFGGLVQVKLSRPVVIKQTGRSTNIAWLYEDFILVKGPPVDAVSLVRDALDRLLTDFAADWYRDNPSK